MSLFNISGCSDWEVTDVGEKLCETFKKDKNAIKKKKKKKKSKDKHNLSNADHSTSSKKHTKVDQLVISLSKRQKTVKRLVERTNIQTLKRKLSKTLPEDQVPLNTSTNSTDRNKSIKKGVKRKRNETNLIQNGESDKHEIEIDKSQRKKRNNKSDFSSINPQKVQTVKKNKTLKSHDNATKAVTPNALGKSLRQLQKLKKLVEENESSAMPALKIGHLLKKKGNDSNLTLRQKMMKKLKAARFRYLNEQIYTTTGKETQKVFRLDPESFKAYHEGYRLQVKQWPVNPVDKIITSLNKMDKNLVIADFGCGEAKLAASVKQKVYSFDLVASNDFVTACDMAHVPLEKASVNIVVFCLSLMGTNLKDYLIEANRVLTKGGSVKIAEVESRFEDVNKFIKACESYGFKNTWRDISHNLFYFMDFKKVVDIADKKKKLPAVTLQPCLYKKR